MEYKYKKIAVKVGSNVITCKDGTLDKERIAALVDQIAALRKNGVDVILISSGAVASGRSEITPSRKLDAVSSRQLFSSIGQSKLINKYYKLFGEHGILVGQVLATKRDFSSRRHYLNMKNCFGVMLDQGVLPIVNENDTISITELMFTDNDELSGMVAAMMDAEALIILSNIDGIYNGDPADPASSVIREIECGKTDLSKYVRTKKSEFGRGGMLTKCNIARKVADEGIEVIIANGKKDHILTDLLSENDTVSTRFVPDKKVSGVKKWISHSEGFSKGKVYVNEGACAALTGHKASSLLPVGIVRIEGRFEKGDLIRILDENGTQLGVGKTSYSSARASELIGKQGAKALVHYDYLYLD